MLPLLLLLAQQPPAPPAPDPPAVSLERIRRGLGSPPPRLVRPRTGHPIYVVFVEGKAVDTFFFPPLWEETVARPAYIQTPHSIVHHELLTAVTPEQFRASTAYPVGIPVLSVARVLARETAKALRARQQRRIRERIQRELAELEAARAAARR